MRREADEAETRGLDVEMLTRIIDQRMSTVTQQLRRDTNSKVEGLLELDKAQIDGLWRLDLESVRSLKSLYPLKRIIPVTTPPYVLQLLRNGMRRRC
jgi:hypothetical protein